MPTVLIRVTGSGHSIDQLPTASSLLSVVSSRLVSVGTNLSGGDIPAINDPGSAVDTNGDTFPDQVNWTLGDISNAPDGIENADDTLVFEVVAVVLDEPVNQSGVVAQTNTFKLSNPDGIILGTVDVDLIAPQLSITKEVIAPDAGYVDAGDSVIFRITVAHTPQSTADAYSLLLTDTLPDPDRSMPA